MKVTTKIITVLEENIRIKLCDFGLGYGLLKIPKYSNNNNFTKIEIFVLQRCNIKN